MDSFINRIEKVGKYPSVQIEQIRKNMLDPSTLRGVIRNEAKPELIPPMGTTTIFEQIMSDSNFPDPYKSLVQNAFDLWMLYSQYEHFGLSSYEFTRNPTGELFNSRIISVLKISIISISFCLKHLNLVEEEEKLKEFFNNELLT